LSHTRILKTPGSLSAFATLLAAASCSEEDAAQEIRAVTDELESILSGEQNAQDVLHAAG
jgi:hypothetical protein